MNNSNHNISILDLTANGQQLEFRGYILSVKPYEDSSSTQANEFSEMNVDPERMELHKEALRIQMESNIDYRSALIKAMNR